MQLAESHAHNQIVFNAHSKNNSSQMPDSDDEKEIKNKKFKNTKLKSKENSEDRWTDYRVCTWNLWCIPCSPRPLSNPDRCSAYMRDLADRQKWNEYDGLLVVALQELWCWKVGIFPPFILRLVALLEYIPYIGRFLSAFFQIIALLLGVLPILKCLPMIYNPKKRFIKKMRVHLPYAVRNDNIPISTALDNGLVLMLNKQPTTTGFEPYEACACDDSLANKGWLWAYFNEQKFLIINTHMQAAGAGRERLMQIRELKYWLYHKWEKKGLVNKAIVLGDFNIDMESHPERIRIATLMKQNSKLQLLPPVENQDPKNNQIGGENCSCSAFRNMSTDNDDDEQKYNVAQKQRQLDSDSALPAYDINININGNDNGNGDGGGCNEAAYHLSTVSTSAGINMRKFADDCKLVDCGEDRLQQFNQGMAELLDDDPLTVLRITGKDSLVDNLRKLQLNRGQRIKFVKKAYINIPYHLGSKFHKLNRYEPTFKRADYNIDHIFANFECKNVTNKLLALGRRKLSDHRLIVTEFSSDT